ncbi:MAG: hypothetical protein GY861_14335 [bacterium]|nr:hypothetical protein [bacterium]
MENREAGLLEIKARIAASRTTLGITSFKRTPTRPSTLKDLPCVFMLEGDDIILKRASRSKTGYPAKRALEVTIELVVNKKDTTDIKTLFLALRKTVFMVIGSDPQTFNPIVADGVFINENRTEGPMGYGLPDIKAMRLVLNLNYNDGGF